MVARKKKAGPKKKAPGRKKKKASPKITVEEFFASVETKPEYIKHLIECRCFLPQFKEMQPEPPNHKFVVFSELNEVGGVKVSYAQCNNCDIVHRVTEVGESITLKKESMRALPTVDDLKTILPPRLSGILSEYECDLHVFQEAKWIIENKAWGRFVVLAKDRDGDIVLGKVCQILGTDLLNVEVFERDESAV